MAVPKVPDWQKQILLGVNAPVNPNTLKFFDAWHTGEGGSAANNPFNTTQSWAGATPYNTLSGGGHVWNYATPQAGIAATIKTLNNGYYGNILTALRAGKDPIAMARALAASPWGTGKNALNVLTSNGIAAVPATTPTGTPSVTMPAGSTPPLKAAAVPKTPTVTAVPNLAGAILGSMGQGPGDQLTAIMSAVTAPKTVSTSAGNVPAPTAAQPPASAKTPPGVPPTKGTESVVDAAKHWVGIADYSWGGGGPGGPSYGIEQGANIKGFDCSGLLQYAYSKAGIKIGGTTYEQWPTGQSVPVKALRPGDAVFFHMKDGFPQHVGIYAGAGKFIEAPYTGAKVRVSDLSSRDDFVGARRWG